MRPYSEQVTAGHDKTFLLGPLSNSWGLINSIHVRTDGLRALRTGRGMRESGGWGGVMAGGVYVQVRGAQANQRE